MFNDPINYIFEILNHNINVVMAIVITTLLVKLLFIPIYIIRFKNTKLKELISQKVKELALSEEQIKTFKKNKKYLYQWVGIKKAKVMIALFAIELAVLILLIKSISSVSLDSVVWLNVAKKDYLMTIIYTIILIINEMRFIKRTPTESKKFQYVLSSAAVIFFCYLSLTVGVNIIIYWMIIVSFNLILTEFLNKYVLSDVKEFDNKSFEKLLYELKII